MNKRSYVIVFIISIVASAYGSVDFYIAPDGSDSNPGTIKKPFLTLEAARNAIRHIKQSQHLKKDVTVWLKPGTYCLSETFDLTPIDSGTEKFPITYKAVENGTVQVLGGKLIPGSFFKPIEDVNVRNRIIEASARSKVLEADLVATGLGIDEIGTMERFGFKMEQPAPTELFFDDQPMTIARWPNKDYTKFETVVRNSSTSRRHMRDVNANMRVVGPTYIPGIFKYSGDRPRFWTQAREIWLHGYWAYDWADDCMPISYLDTEKREITLSAPHLYGITSILGQGQRYYALNMLEEIDIPGEYYIDPYIGIVYFYPPEQISDKTVGFSLLSSPLVSMKDVSHVRFEGITFEMCRNNAIIIEGGQENLLAGCTIRNTGGWAVQILGGSKHAVESCDIYNTGRGGIILKGGDQKMLVRAEHRAINNHIHHFSRRAKTYQFAIAVNGVGILVSNNLIHDAPHAAIDYRGNFNIIELNEIHHVCLESDDAGAINCDKDYSIRGNVVRHNYFHDIIGVRPDSLWLGAHMIYYDSCVSGELITGNIFCNGAREAITVNGGRDMTIENNIFVDLGHPIGVTSIGIGPHRPVVITAYQTMMKKVDPHSSLWAATFPQLAKYPSDPNKLAIPEGNVFSNNLFCRTKDINIAFDPNIPKEIVRTENNQVIDENPFIIVDHHLQLRSDLSALEKLPAIKKIPFDRIGLYKDKYRTKIDTMAQPASK